MQRRSFLATAAAAVTGVLARCEVEPIASTCSVVIESTVNDIGELDPSKAYLVVIDHSSGRYRFVSYREALAPLSTIA